MSPLILLDVPFDPSAIIRSALRGTGEMKRRTILLQSSKMKIMAFKVENFRNIRLAECSNLPDFMVIAGGNGCGKSALLNALLTAKEHAAGYGYFSADPHAVSADADFAR